MRTQPASSPCSSLLLQTMLWCSLCSLWCLALSQAPGQLSPPAHTKSCMLPLPCWLVRRGGLEGCFPFIASTLSSSVTLNRDMYTMLYSRFQVDQSKCLLLTDGTRYSGAVEPASFLYIVHLHFYLLA